MQRKYRRSLSVGTTLSVSTSQRTSMSPYQNWQRISPQGPHRNSSPSPARYHPYVHHPRTPPDTPDRVKPHVSPQSLPPLMIPRYNTSSVRSPYHPHSATSPPAEYSSPKQLPDIHTVFASPSPSPNNLQLPPLQTWTRSMSDPGCCSAPVSAPPSPIPEVRSEPVKDRMRLDSLLS